MYLGQSAMALLILIDSARTLKLILQTSHSQFAIGLILFAIFYAATLILTLWYGFLVTKIGLFFYYLIALQSWIFAMKYV